MRTRILSFVLYVLGLVTGSERYPGAPVLGPTGCIRANSEPASRPSPQSRSAISH